MEFLRKIYKFIIILCVLALVFTFIKNYYFDTKEEKGKNKDGEIEYNGENGLTTSTLNYKDYITEDEETNSDVIAKYLSDGMSISDLKKALKGKGNYVDKEGSYRPISYEFEKQYEYSELEKKFKSLNNSDIVNLEIIGSSVEKRNIYSLEIGKGKDKVLVEGNIHAAEIAPTLFITKFAVDLVNSWESGNDEIEELLKDHTFVMIPSVNPDGYDYTLFGKSTLKDKKSFVYKENDKIDQDFYKANINGVDINRNMPSQLGGLYFKSKDLHYTVSNTKSPLNNAYYAGESLGSEPETQALIYWILKHYKNAHAYISLHSAGRVIYNGKPHLSERFNKISSQCAELFNEYTFYTIYDVENEIDGDGTDGTSTDFIAELIHGYKLSTKTGRLSTDKYDVVSKNLTQETCVLTVETLTNYTQSISTISEEYTSKSLVFW